MADLFNIPEHKDMLNIRDLGAGSGVLSAALIEILQKNYITSQEDDCNETLYTG